MPSALPTSPRPLASTARPAPPASSVPATPELSDAERQVIDALRRTPFGAVEVVLHQHRIVQLVRSEKTRFD